MIVGVNDVVREPRVLRMLLEERLEDGRGFQLLRIFLVARQGGLIHRERVEDARLHVARKFRTTRSMPARRRSARALSRGVPARKELGGRGDKCALARGRRARREGALNGGSPKLNLLRRAKPCEWIAPSAERHAPVRHRAGGVLRRHPSSRDRLREPERMQERNGAIEILPQGRRA